MRNRLCTAAVGIATAALFIICLYANLLEYGGDWKTWVCFIGLSAIFCPFAAAFHELGHLLFGAVVKMRAVPRFRLFGSSSCMVIPKTQKNLKGRLIFTALGGLAVNLLFIIAGLCSVFIPAVPALISYMLPASFYYFALNALPLELYDGKTDGYVVCELIKNTDAAKVTLAVLNVQAQVLGGRPIGEIDKNLLFDLPQIREDDPAFISLTELRYEYFKAKGDVENSEKQRLRFEELKKEYL